MTTARPRRSAPHHISPEEQHHRRQRVLTQGMPSIAGSIAAAVVAKHGNLFFLAPRNGEIPLHGRHGFGLYYHDCRYLNGYEMLIGDVHPESLAATAAAGSRAAFQLTTPDVHTPRGLIEKETLGITWERILDADQCTLYDKISLQNFGAQPVEIPIALTFGAAFEDLFAIRGMVPDKFGTLLAPSWRNGHLWFLYEGADGLYRSLTVRFASPPFTRRGTTAAFQTLLNAEERHDLFISLIVTETDDRQAAFPQEHRPSDLTIIVSDLERASRYWLDQQTQLESNALLLNRVVHRSLLDLHVLKSRLDGQPYFSAGVPWFVTLFGRDSLITSLQTLAFHPAIAEGTLRILARYQGQKTDGWRDEQPGKILHELRVGEMARLNEIPQTPYYGSIDATLLFLILLARHAAWTGSLALFDELRPSVEQALDWMERYADSDRDGYLDYKSSSEKGLVNQGWKDSGNAIVNRDGSLGEPPIALVEVQGYAYMAKILVADLYRRRRDEARAERLLTTARLLRERFTEDYWMADRGCFALAREARGRLCAVVSSNAGHVLWAGLADDAQARQTADRLMEPDMFSGWGIRTLASTERRYNPIGYHLGTVWPHDNSIIAAGFRRYGYDEHAARIFTGMLEAAMEFEHYRLPEVFAGFCREEYGVPVHYPVACHPQAWAAGAVPYLVETALGLVPEAFEQRLRIVRPSLPAFIEHLTLRNLRVGTATLDLRFQRGPDGTVHVDASTIHGSLDIHIDSAHPPSV